MALPVFKTQDEIPEPFRGEYVEVDGEWRVKPAEGGAEDAEALQEAGRKALETERGARRDAEKKARDAEAEAARYKQEAEAKKAGISGEQLDQIRAKVRQDIEKEYATKPLAELPEAWTARTEAQSALQENLTLKLDTKVKGLAAKHGVRAERIDPWWRQFGDRFELTSDGVPMVKGQPGTEVAKFIKDDLKKELPDFYEGTKAAGGGARGGDVRPPNGQAPEFAEIVANPQKALLGE